MIRSVAAGSLALVVLYVFVQSGTAKSLSGASSVVVGGLRRFMAGDVAGVPQRKAPAAASAPAAAPSMTNVKPGMA